MKESRYGYLFIAPCILLIILVLGFPIIYVVAMSFIRYRPLISSEWVGFANYRAIFNNPTFWTSFINTVVFSVFSVVFHILIGMGAALILNLKFRGRRILRTLFLLPWMLSYVVGAITWKWLLNGSYGIVNEIFVRVGLIGSYHAWLGDPRFAMPFVILANIWKQFPFVMLMFIAGLQSIPQEQYEAAWIDGARGFRCFLSITLPNLRNVVIITSTLDFIWSFKQFDLISVMTGGGPGTSTEVLSSLVYQMFFNAFDFGRASATAVILLGAVVLVSFAYARLLFSKDHAEEF